MLKSRFRNERLSFLKAYIVYNKKALLESKAV